MSRISFRDFSSYLILSLPADEIPATGLRRARGVHPVKTASLRSRPGNVIKNSLVSSTSGFVFMENLYQFKGGMLYKDGVALQAIAGTWLAFLQAPTTAGKVDYLFVSNGSALYKISASGEVTQWGITPPIDGFTATAGIGRTISLDDMEDPNAVARWTTATSVTVTRDTTYFVVGASSINLAVVASTTGIIAKSLTVDLSKFSDNTLTSDADYIQLWVNIDVPNNLESIQILFSLGNTTFSGDVLSRTVEMGLADSESSSSGASTTAGLGDTDEYSTADGEKDTQKFYTSTETDQLEIADSNSKQYLYSYVADTLQSDTIATAGVWQKLLLPMSTFTRSGSGAMGWDAVRAIMINVKTNSKGAVNVKLDEFKVVGGTGTQGAYNYYITYYNSATGSRSNPNPTPITVKGIVRQPINIANLPVSTDTQITHIELWRTVGSGAVPFKCAEIAAGTTTYTDEIADAYMLDPREGATYLSSTALYLNNILPAATFGPACLYNASILWISRAAATAGNLYYSPVGYSEGNEGFIRVTYSNDALQNILVWNGVPLVWSKAKIFVISGTNPYYSREVYGCPGTSQPQTVVGSHHGVFYQALDGVRLFSGLKSELVGWGAMNKLFSGEDVENLTAFTGTVATFAKEEYIISDGTQTLAYRHLDKTWRDMGVGFTSLFTDPLTGIAYGSNASGTFKIEQQGTLTDNGTAIPFEIETRHVRLDVDKAVMINLLHIDINTGGNILEATLIADGVETVIGQIQSNGRQVKTININKEYNRIGLRLTGNLTTAVELFGVEVDADIAQSYMQDKYFKNLLVAYS